eukprot:3423485-Rhodomonas_salina.6
MSDQALVPHASRARAPAYRVPEYRTRPSTRRYPYTSDPVARGQDIALGSEGERSHGAAVGHFEAVNGRRFVNGQVVQVDLQSQPPPRS